MFKKIKNRDDVELKVCKGCDAPLPYKPEKLVILTKEMIFAMIVFKKYD